MAKKPGVDSLILGVGVMLVTTVHDVLNELRIIHSVYMISLGVFVFLLIQSYYLMRQYNLAFISTERLSIKLKAMNANLEKLVNRRTLVINEQKKEIETQKSIIESENQQLEINLQKSKENLSYKLSELVQVSSRVDGFVQQLDTLSEHCDEVGNMQIRKTIKGLKSERKKHSEATFFNQFECEHPLFRTKLKIKHPDLTQKEEKMAILIWMNQSNKQIAEFLSNAESTIKTARKLLRKKLGLSPEMDMVDYLQNL